MASQLAISHNQPHIQLHVWGHSVLLYYPLRKLKKLNAEADYPMDYYDNDYESFHFDGQLYLFQLE